MPGTPNDEIFERVLEQIASILNYEGRHVFSAEADQVSEAKVFLTDIATGKQYILTLEEVKF